MSLTIRHAGAITALPDTNEYLPAEAHDLADTWRTLTDRLDELDAEHERATATLTDAQAADAEALRAAILAEQPIPPEQEHEKAARAKVDEIEKRHAVLAAERRRIGNQLHPLLTKHRDEIDRAARELLAPAVDDYRKELETAAQAITQARGRMVRASELLGLAEELHSGFGEAGTQPAVTVKGLDFNPALDEARAIAERVADNTPPLARWRTVRSLKNGAEFNTDPSTARALVQQGEAEYLDDLRDGYSAVA